MRFLRKILVVGLTNVVINVMANYQMILIVKYNETI
jgi:hypothetical protein